jgi:hypothetical protein
VLERVGQPLVDLGRRAGEPVLQSHCQTSPDLLNGSLTFPNTSPRIALMTEDPRLEVNSPSLPGLLSGDLQQADGSPETAGRPQMGRRGETLGCSISREPGGGECYSGSLPRGQRLLPTAQQFKGGGQPSLSCSEAIDVTGPSTASRHVGMASVRSPASSA